MKAAQLTSYGDVDVIVVSSDVEAPTLKDGQVLVDVYAASLNPFDYKVRRGYMKDMMPVTFPLTIGGDFSGKVTAVGGGVNHVAIGDDVYGSANTFGGGSGAFAEVAAAKSGTVAKKPQSADFINAAALPLVGVSAIQALEDHMKLNSGQKVLIHGGSGGIGSVAIQLAKALGAYVATTVSTGQEDFVKALGADEIIDYKTQDFGTMLTDFDGVYDTVGGETYTKSFVVLKKGGTIVTMIEQPDKELDKQHDVTTIQQSTQITNEKLAHLAALVDAGTIKVQLDKVFSLDQAKEAFSYLETGHPKGKVVVAVR